MLPYRQDGALPVALAQTASRWSYRRLNDTPILLHREDTAFSVLYIQNMSSHVLVYGI